MSIFSKINLNNLLNYKSVNFEFANITPEPYRVVYHDEIFKTECIPAINETYDFNGIPFVFPQPSNEGYDNVCSEEQYINIPTRSYSGIHIIGFCDGEGFTETFTLMAPDGTETMIDIFLYSSWKGIEHWSHERNPEICKDVFLATTITNSPRGIFCCSKSFDKSYISSIKLPFNPNMHIFSITLEG
jgi:hypothetical protein